MEELEQLITKILDHVNEEKMNAEVYGRRSSYESSESNVEHQIIGPIISALGWDLTNPKEVTTKYLEQSSEKPDFVLLNENGPVIVIEAKALGKSRGTENLEQVVKYLRHCTNVILTDGLIWTYFDGVDLEFDHTYIDYNPEQFSDYFRDNIQSSFRPKWEFDLSKHHPYYCSALLSSLAKDKPDSIQDYRNRMHEAEIASLRIEIQIINLTLETTIQNLDIISLVRDEILSDIKKHSREKYSHKFTDDKLTTHLEVYIEDSVKKHIFDNIKCEMEKVEES